MVQMFVLLAYYPYYPHSIIVMSPVKRNSYFAMMKDGKLRAFRNIPVGWVLQILHSTDKSDRYFRIVVELFTIGVLLTTMYLLVGTLPMARIIVVVVLVHSVSWFMMGNFWVYMLDSFKFVKNTGLDDTLEFIQFVSKIHSRCDCANAVLIYGSFCRNMFHIRSDIDLRIVRRTDSPRGLLALYYGVLIRAYSFFKMIPVDYQVVDSMAFLKKQMRDDEKPVVAYKRDGFFIENEGVGLSQILANPSSVLKQQA